eukprot:GFUD01025532.1.p1 GENE.GFUD01025532.1~~GFUD01025532.1.p1  ORF type:complete len:192 (-),score=63.37 GFUD01025532.1:116-691(-)
MNTISTTHHEQDSLSMSFDTLLSSQKFSDFTIRCKDQEFPCHKAILQSRSTVFSRMLENNMAEKKTGYLVIEDLEPRTVDTMLKYMYTGKVNTRNDIDQNRAELGQLFIASDKYDMGGLREICKLVFMKQESHENALDILIIADMHGLEDVKEMAMMKIIEIRKFLVDNKSFEDHIMKHPKVMYQILQKML